MANDSRPSTANSNKSQNGEEATLIPVKVAVRVRPLSEKEKQERAKPCVQFPEENQVILGKDRSFTYDYVFTPDSSQDEIFLSCVKPLAQYCLQGYNATILAYGQTGSGKTHTMGTNGSKQVPAEQLGIIPRVIESIFTQLSETNTNVKIRCSFLELYNEEIRDMLNPDSDKPMAIREDSFGVFVTNLKEEEVTTKEEMEQVLLKGSLSRTVGSTLMNTESSRSHAIFTVIMDREDPQDPSNVVTSRLHFVDLAGSERLSRTKAEGARMKEGISINGGLLALGNVISALGDPKRKSKHIPYRDSKLTRILQDSLGGNSRTLMIACCSPSDTNIEETLNTLKYADRARQIKNKPIVNVDPVKMELIKLRKHVLDLSRELLKYKELSGESGTIGNTTTGQTVQESFDKLVVERLEDKIRQLARENMELNQSLNRSDRKFKLLLHRTAALEHKFQTPDTSVEDIERNIQSEIRQTIVEEDNSLNSDSSSIFSTPRRSSFAFSPRTSSTNLLNKSSSNISISSVAASNSDSAASSSEHLPSATAATTETHSEKSLLDEQNQSDLGEYTDDVARQLNFEDLVLNNDDLMMSAEELMNDDSYFDVDELLTDLGGDVTQQLLALVNSSFHHEGA